MESSRKTFKNTAREVLKKHYLILVVICLVASVVGTSVDNSLTSIKYQKIGSQENITEKLNDALSKVEKYEQDENGKEIVGHTSGVFSKIVNNLSSGSLSLKILQGVGQTIKSTHIAVKILLVLSTAIVFLFWFFITNSIVVVQARIFLESRIYDHVPPTRMAFLFRIKRWVKSCYTIFVEIVYLFLWFFTIVGGFIKMYAYALVPYIVAENPDINADDAIKLSNELMKGHKKELFVIDLSFLGWELLGILTLGLSKILYSAPYKTATHCEFYAKLRNDAKKEKKIKNLHLLDDKYLYEKASREELNNSYGDVLNKLEELKVEYEKPTTLKEKIFDFLGIASKNVKKEKNYELKQMKVIETKNIKDELRGKAYPIRLFKIKQKTWKIRKLNLNYMRRYSASSLILIFIITSFIGWIWEVSLHLVTDGEFVNRGVQYGPWLPIYGAGSIVILLLLNKLRKRPAICFFSAVTICGIIEYFTALLLETVNNGTRWWDYSGYFLNLHGRICAEGLLIFGIGGLAIVYFIAPFLDNLFRKVDKKHLYIACTILSIVFTIDKIYSLKHPNIGEGITNYSSYVIEENNYEKNWY